MNLPCFSKRYGISQIDLNVILDPRRRGRVSLLGYNWATHCRLQTIRIYKRMGLWLDVY